MRLHFPRVERAKRCLLGVGIALLLSFSRPDIGAAAALPDDNGYGTVAVSARVLDRQGMPARGVLVRFRTDLAGTVLNEPGVSGASPSAKWMMWRASGAAVSGPDGIATVRIASPIPGMGSIQRPWFRGRVRVEAVATPTKTHDACASDPDLAAADADGTASGIVDVPPGAALAVPADLPTLRIWEAPDRHVDGFPLWLGRDKRADRVVVLVEGFDLYNRYSATDGLRLIGGAGDALRAAGVDILVVDFPDSHQSPDVLAPRVAQAIRAASAASGGRPVAVAGLSAGGLAARWALVTAEESGVPLPVNTLVFLDTPHRGANLNPALQALVLRYGKRGDREALGSDAARALLALAITDPATQVRYRSVGVWPAHRAVPIECWPTSALHDAFYTRLRSLNDRGGYPKRCRLVAIANSSRSANGTEDRDRNLTLMRLWVPWGGGWKLPATDADLAPGSLLPDLYASQFAIRYPFGLAGAYLRAAPTFLTAASALDAAPGQTPPFAAWYARADGLPPLAHDRVDPGAAAFAVGELLRPDTWKTAPEALLAEKARE